MANHASRGLERFEIPGFIKSCKVLVRMRKKGGDGRYIEYGPCFFFSFSIINGAKSNYCGVKKFESLGMTPRRYPPAVVDSYSMEGRLKRMG